MLYEVVDSDWGTGDLSLLVNPNFSRTPESMSDDWELGSDFSGESENSLSLIWSKYPFPFDESSVIGLRRFDVYFFATYSRNPSSKFWTFFWNYEIMILKYFQRTFNFLMDIFEIQ